MIYDIIEAIQYYYKDNTETMVDCLRWLSPLDPIRCDDEIRRLGYCPNCGEKLQDFTWHVYHSEVDSPPRYEVEHEIMCPNCDF